jgi:hypothetical protein
MSTLLELSQFCGSTQGDCSAPTSGAPPEGGVWNLLNITPVANSDGYFAEAWRNSTTGEIVIANRGTDPTDLGNLWSDAQLANGNPTKAAADAGRD